MFATSGAAEGVRGVGPGGILTEGDFGAMVGVARFSPRGAKIFAAEPTSGCQPIMFSIHRHAIGGTTLADERT